MGMLADVRVRSNPNLMLSFAGELKFCDDLLERIYAKMSEAEEKERRRQVGGFFSKIRKLLTLKKKGLNS